MRLLAAVVLAVSALLAPGCATRSVREGAACFDPLVPPPAITKLPAALDGVEVTGEDLRETYDQRWLAFVPLVPYGRTVEPTVRGAELEPELLRVLRPRFRGAPGDRRVRVRCVIGESFCEETRTLYGLSLAGVAIGGLFGPPLRFMRGRAEARFEVVDAGAPPGAEPLFALRVEGTCRARAGVAGFLYWYNTDVKPRDATFEAWADAVQDFIFALPPPQSAVWRTRS